MIIGSVDKTAETQVEILLTELKKQIKLNLHRECT